MCVTFHSMKDQEFKVWAFFYNMLSVKNGVFWDVTLCGSCKNRRSGGTWHLLHQGEPSRLLVTACVVPSSPFLVTLMKKALSSSGTSALTRATWCNISEDTILHSLPWKPQILHMLSGLTFIWTELMREYLECITTCHMYHIDFTETCNEESELCLCNGIH
jgi:hypothetical protein